MKRATRGAPCRWRTVPLVDRCVGSYAVVEPPTPPTGSTLARDVVFYSAARLAIVAVVALLLLLAGVPLLVSILLALVVALPLSMFLLGSLRARVNQGMVAARARRRSERVRLRTQLRGEQGSSDQP